MTEVSYHVIDRVIKKMSDSYTILACTKNEKGEQLDFTVNHFGHFRILKNKKIIYNGNSVGAAIKSYVENGGEHILQD